jgi:UDP-N-acetylmuramyl pentapeptide synthase
VTPGLVDQGEETQRVHIQVGKLIAAAQPDLVILMRNSATSYIETGLKQGQYTGKLQIEANPLEFYTNLSHFVASGDLVVMQNDWTDNYA